MSLNKTPESIKKLLRPFYYKFRRNPQVSQLDPRWITVQTKLKASKKIVDLGCGKSRYIDASDRVMDLPDAEVACAKLSGGDVRDPYAEARYTYYGSLGACSLYRKEVWERLGGYDETLHGSEDFDFWLRASGRFKIGRIPWEEEPLYVYRSHSTSISATVKGCFTEARLKILRREA